jgi:hypothetical protein
MQDVASGTFTVTTKKTTRRGPGAPLGEAHGRARLRDADVRVIRRLGLLGIPSAKLGAGWRVSEATIRAVLTRKTWRHVRGEA